MASIKISKLFKFIVHEDVVVPMKPIYLYFKTFQVYSSYYTTNTENNSLYYFKTFQVYSSYKILLLEQQKG